MRLNLFALLAALIIGLSAVTSVTAAKPNEAGPLPLVGTTLVAVEPIRSEQTYIAHVEALQEVDLQARVTGVIEDIAFQEGAMVKAGQLLYQLEQAPYQAAVAVAQARVAKTEAVLSQTVQRLKRLRLVQPEALPVTDLEAAEAAEQQARADLREAQANLRLRDIDLAYTRISAPISGSIGATRLTVGNLAGPSAGVLANIVQLDPIRVRFAVSETELDLISTMRRNAFAADSPQARLSLRFKQTNGRLLETGGRIDFVDNKVDPTTGTVEIYARVDNPEGNLLPGQFLTLLLGTAAAAEMPVVPLNAVLEDRSGSYVLLVNGAGQVEQRRIETAEPLGRIRPVRHGLQGGEQLIVEGLQKVRPGQAVKAVAVKD